jgi:hypothetical protein
MMDAFHFFYALLVVASAAIGIIGFVAGVMFLSGSGSRHFCGILAAVLSLWSIPIGTTLGIYTLILLLPISERPAGTAAARAQVSA